MNKNRKKILDFCNENNLEVDELFYEHHDFVSGYWCLFLKNGESYESCTCEENVSVSVDIMIEDMVHDIKIGYLK